MFITFLKMEHMLFPLFLFSEEIGWYKGCCSNWLVSGTMNHRDLVMTGVGETEAAAGDMAYPNAQLN